MELRIVEDERKLQSAQAVMTVKRAIGKTVAMMKKQQKRTKRLE